MMLPLTLSPPVMNSFCAFCLPSAYQGVSNYAAIMFLVTHQLRKSVIAHGDGAVWSVFNDDLQRGRHNSPAFFAAPFVTSPFSLASITQLTSFPSLFLMLSWKIPFV